MAVLKNVENKIKLVMIVSSLFLVGCVIVSLGSIIIAKGMVDEAHKKVYVLDGTVPILVKQTTQEETFDVEAKSDIEMFHQFFFTLAPDDKYIQYTMKKAMYLVDETGLAQYNALKEKGFYNNIIGTSTICSIYCDSIKLNTDSLTFTYYGRQRIERRTSILMRQLVTRRQAQKSAENREQPSRNPHHQLANTEEPRLGGNQEVRLLNQATMDIKKVLMGEKMPDKNDPQYREQYEREVRAGQKFAEKTKLNILFLKIQEWANDHRKTFLGIVFGLVISLFAWNVINMIRYYNASKEQKRHTAVERVEKALQEQRNSHKAQ